jgi:hypothetical protein
MCVIDVQFVRFEVDTSVRLYSIRQTGEPIVLAIHLVSHSRVPYGLVHSCDCCLLLLLVAVVVLIVFLHDGEINRATA